jgi:hypothetical protein
MLTLEQATAELGATWWKKEGVWWYDVGRIPSSDPIEDDYVEETTSAKLRQVLITVLARGYYTYRVGSAFKA